MTEQHDAFDKLQGVGCPTHGMLMGVVREKAREIEMILKVLYDWLKSLNFVFMKPAEGYIYFLKIAFSNLGTRLGNRVESVNKVDPSLRGVKVIQIRNRV